MHVAVTRDFVAVILKQPERLLEFFQATRSDRNRHADPVGIQHLDERGEAPSQVFALVDITGQRNREHPHAPA